MEAALHEAGVIFLHRYDFERRHDSLFFMSQKEKGLRVMKNVMKNRSTSDEGGVPSFSFNRAGEQPKQLDLFAEKAPLVLLHDDLLEHFAGRSLTFEMIVREHHPGTQYVDKNYREVLLGMEARGEITTSPAIRRVGTFGPDVRVSFPTLKG
jgi:hypothetical protein